jgi:hypothetical protein
VKKSATDFNGWQEWRKWVVFSPHPRGETARLVALDVCRPEKVALTNFLWPIHKLRKAPKHYPES